MVHFVSPVASTPAKHKFLKITAIILLLCIVPLELCAQTASSEEEYLVQFFTMLNKTQKRLVLMNKEGNLAKLGEEGIPGLISGTLSYKTSIKGLSGVITLSYDNFSDEEGWTFTGDIIVKSNMMANGSFDGKIAVKGTRPGTVYYDKVIMKSGKAAGGTYGVELPGKKRVEVDYSWYFKSEQ